LWLEFSTQLLKPITFYHSKSMFIGENKEGNGFLTLFRVESFVALKTHPPRIQGLFA
jgi:hypothetical protein